MKIKYNLSRIILLPLILLVYCSCNKSTEQTKPATIDFSKLTQNDWLITPPKSIGYQCDIRNQILYQDSVVIRDTTRLYFHTNSTWRRRLFPSEIWYFDTIPHTGPCGSYFLHGVSDNSGTYTLNPSDSTITTISIIPGYILPPVIYKVLLLTNDSLKLWQSVEGTSTYYAY